MAFSSRQDGAEAYSAGMAKKPLRLKCRFASNSMPEGYGR
jgi:hypothetical protein